MLLTIQPEKESSSPSSSSQHAIPIIEDRLPVRISLTSPLLDREGHTILLDTANWSHVDMWDTILCPSVLVSRKELLLLVAGRMEATHTRAGMIKVSQCQWFIGRHVSVQTREGLRLHYWGSGTYDHIYGVKKSPTWVEVAGYDNLPNSRQKTSRLALVVCGIQLSKIHESMGTRLPPHLRDVSGIDGDDTVTFLLVRYAQPHASATQRGPQLRPLCPGPFKNSHCLWTWTTRPGGYQCGCFRERPWERHRRYFGRTIDDQQRVRQRDSRAWYDLVQVTNIKGYANVQPDVDEMKQEVFLQSVLW